MNHKTIVAVGLAAAIATACWWTLRSNEERAALPAPAVAPAPLPERLSQTGLFLDLPALAPAPGVIAYTVRHELWSDGLGKFRHVRFPAGSRLEVERNGEFSFPVGTLFSKTFEIPRDVSAPHPGRASRIETRLLVKGADRWDFATYVWNERQDDAVKTDGYDCPTTAVIPGTNERYTVPGRIACIQCHLGQSDVAIGFAPYQLEDSLLRELERSGVLCTPVDAIPNRLVRGETPLEQEAVGYIAGNCAHCHNPASSNFAGARLDLRHDRVKDSVVGVRATRLSRADASVLVVPGDSHASVVYRLFARTFSSPHDRPVHMPPIGNRRVDPRGEALLSRWIEDLAGRGTPEDRRGG